MSNSHGSPQAVHDLRHCARHLLMNPLLCAEINPDTFLLVRRHASELDRWFAQRLGYRLHVGADTARLTKGGYIPDDRPLRTRTGRPFNRLEYVLLALTLGCTVAGPAVMSLSDLARDIRSAAVEAEIDLPGEGTERRALVGVLRWMIEHGLAEELFEQIDAYSHDENADAVLRVRPDRIAILPSPAMDGAAEIGIDGSGIIANAERRDLMRTWMRARLVEDPVVYRDDLTDIEWTELRRRIGEEARYIDEMFAMVLEVRAEGVAVIDPEGDLSDVRFPISGTLGHATLCLIDELVNPSTGPATQDSATRTPITQNPVTRDSVTRTPITRKEIEVIIGALVESHPRWDKQLRSSPSTLTRRIVSLLVHLRLATEHDDVITLQPAAARFAVVEMPATSSEPSEQEALW